MRQKKAQEEQIEECKEIMKGDEGTKERIISSMIHILSFTMPLSAVLLGVCALAAALIDGMSQMWLAVGAFAILIVLGALLMLICMDRFYKKG